MAKKTLYWNGPGVYSLGKKDYAEGDKLPDSIDEKTAASLVKKGLAVSDAPKPGRPSGEVAQLREQIGELKDQLKAAPSQDQLDQARAGLEELQGRGDDLTAEKEELQEKLTASEKAVSDLSDQIQKDAKKETETDTAGPKKK